MTKAETSEPNLHRWQCNRRSFLLGTLSASLTPWGAALAARQGILVNDCHSQLNPTTVREIYYPSTVGGLRKLIAQARKESQPLAICGARHAAGGQQFLRDGVLLDMTRLKKVSLLDARSGLVKIEGGAIWSDVQATLEAMQTDAPHPWGINQKQTGLNNLTIGGTVGANAHGQGLKLKPFVDDIKSLRLMNADGELVECSRDKQPELFSLVVGGYGLFGIVYDVTLQLVPRQKVKRIVRLIKNDEMNKKVDDSISKGYRYGHYQLNIDEHSPGYLKEGIFATYSPVAPDTHINGSDKTVGSEHWLNLIEMVHRDKKSAYDTYVKFYESTDGFVNWADAWQNSYYETGYHKRLDAEHPATEVLCEFYVPMQKVDDFLKSAREYFLVHGCNVIFSTVRFIEKDDVTFLPWARQRYACIIFNFHTVHKKIDIDRTINAWSHLIDRSIALDGSFYLTYQHVANREQLLACYPKFQSFMKLKLRYDPQEIFQSDWYRWHKRLFA